MANIEDILAQVDSKIRKNFTTAEGMKAEKLELPSIGLTRGLGGGLGAGKIATIHGSKSAGKSSLMLQTVGIAQEEGKTCAWVDAEKAFDSEWAERMGVDCSQLIVTKASDMIRVGNEVVALIDAGIEFVVIDSISALIQPSYLDKDNKDLAGMEATGKIGSFSQGIKKVIRSINHVNDNAVVVFISQQTTQFLGSSGYTRQVAEGGNAVEYYSSQVIRLHSPMSKKTNIIKEVDVGNRLYEGIVGRKVHWEVQYNKLGHDGESGTYEFYHTGPTVGVDNRLEVMDLALGAGIMERRGAWYYYGDDKWNGADAVVEWLSDKDNFKQLKGEFL